MSVDVSMYVSVDPKSPVIEVREEELHNHQRYVYYKLLAERLGKRLAVIPTPSPQKPHGALTLTREEARDTQTYEAAKARSERERRPLWIEPE